VLCKIGMELAELKENQENQHRELAKNMHWMRLKACELVILAEVEFRKQIKLVDQQTILNGKILAVVEILNKQKQISSKFIQTIGTMERDEGGWERWKILRQAEEEMKFQFECRGIPTIQIELIAFVSGPKLPFHSLMMKLQCFQLQLEETIKLHTESSESQQRKFSCPDQSGKSFESAEEAIIKSEVKDQTNKIREEKQMEKQLNIPLQSANLSVFHEESPLEVGKSAQGSFELLLPHLGFSLIDHQPRELIYIHINQLQLNYRYLSGISHAINLSMEDLEIDDQTTKAPFPIIVKSQRENQLEQAFNITINTPMDCLSEIGEETLVKLNDLSLHLSHLEINLHEELVWEMIKFLSAAFRPPSGQKNQEEQLAEQEVEYNISKPEENRAIAGSSSLELMLNSLSLAPIKVTLTALPRSGSRKVVNRMGKLDFLGWIAGFASGMVGGLREMPIKLPGRTVRDFRGTPEDLVKRVAGSMRNSIATQSIKAMAYLDVLGQPGKAAERIGKGMKETISAPIEGFRTGKPAEGIMKGITAPVRYAAAAAMEPAGNLLLNIGKGMEALGGGESSQEHQEAPSRAVEGISQGASGLKESMNQSVKQGIQGNLISAIANPIAGSVKALGSAMEGIAREAIQEGTERLERVRQRRKFGPKGKILSYQPDEQGAMEKKEGALSK
jgi:hypothetical protein